VFSLYFATPSTKGQKQPKNGLKTPEKRQRKGRETAEKWPKFTSNYETELFEKERAL